MRVRWPRLTGYVGHIDAPALRTYVLKGMFVPFTAPQLRSLSLHNSMLWTELLEVARSCPLLTTLRLGEMERSNIVIRVPRSAQPAVVTLPHLQELSLRSPLHPGTIDFLYS